MRLAIAILAFAMVAACGQAETGNRTAPGNVAGGANQPCAGRSRQAPGQPDRPETWGRSDYDQCMAGESNKSNPADPALCPDTIQEGRCVLTIL